jgi:hypothetical protein
MLYGINKFIEKLKEKILIKIFYGTNIVFYIEIYLFHRVFFFSPKFVKWAGWQSCTRGL